MTLKFGFDLHGVLDRKPEQFAVLTKTLVAAGHEVHVITGSHWSEELEDQLKRKLNLTYTHFFSIADYHSKVGTPITYRNGNPYLDDYLWNRTKGDYCKEQGIFLHLDDSGDYGRHFKETIYAQVRR